MNNMASTNLKAQRSFQLDVKDGEWELLKSKLMQIKPTKRLSTRAFEELSHWNGFADINATGVTIYSQWIREISKVVYGKYRP